MATRKYLNRIAKPGYKLVFYLQDLKKVEFFFPRSYFRNFAIVATFSFSIYLMWQMVNYLEIDEGSFSDFTEESNLESKSKSEQFHKRLKILGIRLKKLERIHKQISQVRFGKFTEDQLHLSQLYKIYEPDTFSQGGAGSESSEIKKRSKSFSRTFPLKRNILVTNAFIKDLSLFIGSYGIWFQYYPSLWPMKGDAKYVTSSFGYRIAPTGYNKGSTHFHSGVDLRARSGTKVISTAGGTVHIAKAKSFGYGKRIRIVHDTGYETLYAHLSHIKVRENQKVKQGQVIGYVGSSGNSTGPHLHYEVRLNGKKLNPKKFMDR